MALPSNVLRFDRAQDLADLVRADGVGGGGGGGAAFDFRGASGSGGEADHVAGARGMALALAALQGLLHHLELPEDPSNHGTFSLTLGNFISSGGFCSILDEREWLWCFLCHTGRRCKIVRETARPFRVSCRTWLLRPLS